MKTKKVVVGAIAATMLSLSVCPIAPAVAAGETVQISVSSAEAKAGEQFTVNVSLSDVPSAGIQILDFGIAYDPTLITIDSVTAGEVTDTGAGSADPTGGSNGASVFQSSIHNDEGSVSLLFTTGLEDSSYWLKKDGVFCTITGTVASTAAENTVADLKIIPVDRAATDQAGASQNDSISCGYFNGTTKVSYEVKTNDGKVTVAGNKTGLRGDADRNGTVAMNDVVLIMQSISNKDKYGIGGSDDNALTLDGAANADVAGDPAGATTKADKGGDGISVNDALRIQQFLLELIPEL